MATFVDPVADAAEAYEGLRGLAHATRAFEDPVDMYRVLGEVSGSVRLLRQVLDQLSRAHADHRDIAFTDDRAPAEAVALAAADELHQAADGLDEVADRVMRAHEASGRIAWHTHTIPEPERSPRWVNVVFLQGPEADEVLELIDVEGVQAGITHLAQWDFGDETTAAAFVNGEVYDELPGGQWDRSFEADGYVLTYNPQRGYVGLVREHPDTVPDPSYDEDVVAARDALSGVTSESPRRAADGTDWFAPKVGGGAASSSVGRSL
ncbi:hypothetical protein FAM23877_02295 [Propionibacterium freudenreichii]|uniref:hypothetical protein n=1 Tax=Propionibacterium freudenreichii TaxID=1744 RepID=UPI0024866AA0|nr:hypothetical protein [Propionibacterium freudenreichii]MDK9295691.1 hypothetical protein [Propionibacterium freudenreichii]MDK9361082.1 hypothetical protein [Propionibacterium freudenreichii]MDK9639094.1 hypothetical protein [Propionibacterium freudenreichii]MDK9659396.1 hypothetical protein [Propionibacterium freudenreichii]WGU90791.1 hypothetical protein FAM23877_02295 [Propionibacterium freudenreichii]